MAYPKTRENPRIWVWKHGRESKGDLGGSRDSAMCLRPGLCLAVLMPLGVGWRPGRIRGPEAAHLVAALLLCVCLFVCLLCFWDTGSPFVVLADLNLPSVVITCSEPRSS